MRRRWTRQTLAAIGATGALPGIAGRAFAQTRVLNVRADGDADDFVCLATPMDFGAIGMFYQDFTQTTDDEVIALLDRAAGS